MMAVAGPALRDPHGQALDRRAGNSGSLLDHVRRVVGQALGPAGDERAGARMRIARGKLLAQDDVRNSQREHAFRSRPARNPFVGIGAGLRHAGLDLHESAATPDASLAHFAVADGLRDGRVPCAQEIGAEGNDVVGSREIQRRAARASRS